MAICECGNEVIGEHPVCSICGTLIHHPLEKIIYGTEKGIQFHDDCYLAQMGVPEELIDHIEIIQKGDQITTVIDMTGEIPEDVEE